MLRQIEDGTGLGFTILIKDKVEQFRLVIIARNNWRTKEWNDYAFTYMNINNTVCTTNCYSGGNTGFGCDPKYGMTNINQEWLKHNIIVTDNLEEMKAIALSEAKQQADERDAEQAKKAQIAIKINELPTKFSIRLAKLDQFQFIRTEANYNPRQSSYVYGASVHIEKKQKKGGNTYNNTFNLSYYLTKDNKAQVKKFAEAANRFFGQDIMKQFNPKELFLYLLAKHREIKNKINEIKNQ